MIQIWEEDPTRTSVTGGKEASWQRTETREEERIMEKYKEEEEKRRKEMDEMARQKIYIINGKNGDIGKGRNCDEIG